MKFAIVGLREFENALGMEWLTSGFNALGRALNNREHIAHGYLWSKAVDQVDDIICGGYDVVIVPTTDIESAYELLRMLQPIRTVTKLIVFADFVHGRIEFAQPRIKIMLFDIYNNLCDIVWAVNAVSKIYLSTIVDDGAKVRVFGFPVDINGISVFSKEAKCIPEDDLVLHGFVYTLSYHNIIYAMKAMQKSGLRSIGYCYESLIHEYSNVFDKFGLGDTVILCRAVSMDQYIREGICRCSIALSLMVRHALGKTAAECAVVGRPSMGTANYFNEELFPSLVIRDTGSILLPSTLLKLKQHMADGDDRKYVCDYAREKVEDYRLENFAEGFIDAAISI